MFNFQLIYIYNSRKQHKDQEKSQVSDISFFFYLYWMSLLNIFRDCTGYVVVAGSDKTPCILEDFVNATQYFCTFLAKIVNAVKKLLAGFNLQPRIGMNQSLI